MSDKPKDELPLFTQGNVDPPVYEEVATPAVNMNPTRDQIREAILNAKAEIKSTTFAGVAVELHQPTLDEILSMEDSEGDNRKSNMVNMIVMYTYVPGTSTKVFDEADRNVLLGVPFGKDMQRLLKSFSDLTGVDVTDADKSGAAK
jgi:hypothetical protein